MSKMVLTWRSMQDARTCKICKALNGYTWTFEPSKESFPVALVHPSLGAVWHMTVGSIAHGHTGINCRCHLEFSFELEDVLAKCVYLFELIQGMAA